VDDTRVCRDRHADGTPRAHVPDSEILTIAAVAATDGGRYHERAAQTMHGCSYLPGRISVVRCNSSSASTHRLHQRADEMAWILGTLEAVLPTGDGVISDRLPVPVYRQVRARRGRKVRRRAYCGSCAANRETFVGWRVHVVCRLDGVPVRVQMLPAGVHDLTPVHELAYGLPAGARRLGVAANNYSPQQRR